MRTPTIQAEKDRIRREVSSQLNKLSGGAYTESTLVGSPVGMDIYADLVGVWVIGVQDVRKDTGETVGIHWHVLVQDLVRVPNIPYGIINFPIGPEGVSSQDIHDCVVDRARFLCSTDNILTPLDGKALHNKAYQDEAFHRLLVNTSQR